MTARRVLGEITNIASNTRKQPLQAKEQKVPAKSGGSESDLIEQCSAKILDLWKMFVTDHGSYSSSLSQLATGLHPRSPPQFDLSILNDSDLDMDSSESSDDGLLSSPSRTEWAHLAHKQTSTLAQRSYDLDRNRDISIIVPDCGSTSREARLVQAQTRVKLAEKYKDSQDGLQSPESPSKTSRVCETPAKAARDPSDCIFQDTPNDLEDSVQDVEEALLGMTKHFLRAQHLNSERSRPSANCILTKLGAVERALAVDWLLEACKAMSFPEGVAFAAVSLFDRYLNTLEVAVPTEQMQVLMLSATSIALKFHGMSQVPVSLRELLAHLGQHRVPVNCILQKEKEVLEALDFKVSTPTVLDILATLVWRCRAPAKEATCGCCGACCFLSEWQRAAEFFLHLALRKADLLYEYPHMILAASAAYLAWYHVGMRPCQAQQRSLLRFLRRTRAGGRWWLSSRHHYCI